MCGIAGRIGSVLGAEESEARVDACLARLSHRGPDGHGVHRAPVAGDAAYRYVERAVALFYAARDRIRYDPYQISGAPADYRASSVALAGHGWCVPKASLLAANFSISREAQTFLAKFGRLPTRPDVETNPPGVLKALDGKKIVTVLLNTEEDRRRIRQFNDIFKPR